MKADMDTRYRTIASGPQSVLGATLVALGSDRRYVEAATGLDAGVHLHRFASDAHAISTDDAERITQVITAQASAGPAFWTDYVRRCTTGAGRLLERLRSLAKTGEHPPEPARLLDGFTGFAEAMKAMAPFTLVTRSSSTTLSSRYGVGRATVRRSV